MQIMLSAARGSLSMRAAGARACRATRAVRRFCKAADPEAAMEMSEDTPLALQRRFAALDGLQMQYDNMEKMYEQKLRDMEAEFFRATEHVLERRTAIVSGASEPTDDEVMHSTFETAHLVGTEVPTAGVPAGVPGFWATAIKQCISTHDPDDPDEEPRFSERDWEARAVARAPHAAPIPWLRRLSAGWALPLARSRC